MGAGDEGELAALPLHPEDDDVLKEERTVWFFWAVFFFAAGVNSMCDTQFFSLVNEADCFPPLVTVFLILFFIFYVFVFVGVVIVYETKPLKLSPRARLLIDVAFVVFSFGLAFYYCNDVLFVLLGFATSQHLLPTFNLLTCFGNFTGFDAARALLIQAAALVSCACAPPFVPALASIVLLLLRSYYYIKQQHHYIQLSEDEEGELAAPPPPEDDEVKVKKVVWMLWAGFSSGAVLVTVLDLHDKLVTHPLLKDDVAMLFFYYGILITTIPIWYKTKPLKLSPRVRLLVDVAFVAFSFGLAFWNKDDVEFVLLGFATSQHVMPMFNMLTCFGNFTALDVALALLIQAAALVSCGGVYQTSYAPPPLVAALASIILVLLKTSYCIQQQQQQQLQLQPSDSDRDYYSIV